MLCTLEISATWRGVYQVPAGMDVEAARSQDHSPPDARSEIASPSAQN